MRCALADGGFAGPSLFRAACFLAMRLPGYWRKQPEIDIHWLKRRWSRVNDRDMAAGYMVDESA